MNFQTGQLSSVQEFSDPKCQSCQVEKPWPGNRGTDGSGGAPAWPAGEFTGVPVACERRPAPRHGGGRGVAVESTGRPEGGGPEGPAVTRGRGAAGLRREPVPRPALPACGAPAGALPGLGQIFHGANSKAVER